MNQNETVPAVLAPRAYRAPAAEPSTRISTMALLVCFGLFVMFVVLNW